MSFLQSIKSLVRQKVLGGSPEVRPFSGVATLLLSDVSGIDPLREGMDVEHLARSFTSALGSSGQAICDHEGIMISSVGDACLAVWDPEHSTPSHADLALAAGRAILNRVWEVKSETGIEFRIRIALATGRMTADWIGGRFQVVGSPYATATRLMRLEVLKRSQLLFTSETLAHLSKPEVSEPVAQVKGTTGQDVAVFEVTG